MPPDYKIFRVRRALFDHHCPYCKSGETYKGLTSYEAKVGGDSDAMPMATIEVWHCAECFRVFELY